MIRFSDAGRGLHLQLETSGRKQFRRASRSGGVAGRYLQTRRQVARQMGVAGFTHSGQPGQGLGRMSGGCKTPALSEQSSR